jgi:hypothetical protein
MARRKAEEEAARKKAEVFRVFVSMCLCSCVVTCGYPVCLCLRVAVSVHVRSVWHYSCVLRLHSCVHA